MEEIYKSLIAEYAKAAADKANAEAIDSLKQIKSTLSGDDSGLCNAWDEICVQVQGEESFFWDEYQDVMSDAVLGVLQTFAPRDLAALWLHSAEGWDWGFDIEDEKRDESGVRTLQSLLVPYSVEDIAKYIVQNRILVSAKYFTNSQIAEFLNKDENDDDEDEDEDEDAVQEEEPTEDPKPSRLDPDEALRIFTSDFGEDFSEMLLVLIDARIAKALQLAKTKYVAWSPNGQEILGAIQLPIAQSLNNRVYLEHLQARLEGMAEDSDPTDLQQVSDLLVEAGLLYSPLDPSEPIGMQLILDNEDMLMRLRELGIPGEMPLRVTVSNKAAQTAIDQTSLLGWTLEVVSGLICRYEG